MKTLEFTINTGNKPAVVDITSKIEEAIKDLQEGLVHIFVPHATAGLALMETGSGSEYDLINAIDQLFPKSSNYRHAHGSPGHGRDHILPAFISPFLVLAVRDKRLQLGTWQSVVLVDTNVDNPIRKVQVNLISSIV